MNCVERFYLNDIANSNKVAIVFYNGLKSLKQRQNIVTFNQLRENSIKAQELLKSKKVGKNDIILLFEQPTPNLYAIMLGALALGSKLLIIEPWMSGKKIDSIILKYKPKAIIGGVAAKLFLKKSKQASHCSQFIKSKLIHQYQAQSDIIIEKMRADDSAIIAFTSGTSGTPKGAHRKHQFLIDQSDIIKKHINYNDTSKLDLTVFTNLVLLNLGLGKGSLVVATHWKEKIIKELDYLPEKFSIDTMACGPYFLKLLLENTTKLKLKSVHIGGALGDISLYKKAVMRWPGAHLNQIYGSTEAEPVAICELKKSIHESEKQGYMQAIFVGEKITDITILEREGSTWVSGKNVSPMYENDEAANKKNKYLDENNVLWHNMGDRIIRDEKGLWYMGRDFQSQEQFDLEQKIYKFIGHTRAFLTIYNNKLSLFGEVTAAQKLTIREKFPVIENVQYRSIIRDPRHRARIDREQSLENGSNFANIILFIKERVPSIANLILGLGLLLSANSLLNSTIPLALGVFALISLVIFITELRFMDELKDLEKDIIANPQRPLPLGVISSSQLQKLVNVTMASLLGLSAICMSLLERRAGIYLSITTVWLYLMYKEFFIPKMINKSPIIYAISHQVIIVPVCLFTLALGDTAQLSANTQLGFSLLILSSFFTFEVGRKMDPNANKILGTYLAHYGVAKTHSMIVILQLMGLYGAYLLELQNWLIPGFILTFLTQLRVLKNNSVFKDLEGIIALSLIFNLWVVFISGLIS